MVWNLCTLKEGFVFDTTNYSLNLKIDMFVSLLLFYIHLNITNTPNEASVCKKS